MSYQKLTKNSRFITVWGMEAEKVDGEGDWYIIAISSIVLIKRNLDRNAWLVLNTGGMLYLPLWRNVDNIHDTNHRLNDETLCQLSRI